MKELGKIYAHIPARGASKRVPAKNLRLLCGKPLISYAIECAKNCKNFDDIFVNTDSDEIASLAKAYGVSVYKRDPHLASDEAKGDDFTADFIENTKPDTLVMISPVCPLIESSDVDQAVKLFQSNTCDTLITCQQTQMQTFCDGQSVNISLAGGLAPSQQNRVVKILNWAVTIWDSQIFLKNHRTENIGYIGKNRFLMPIPAFKGLKISHEEDFQMAEILLKMRTQSLHQDGPPPPQYWKDG